MNKYIIIIILIGILGFLFNTEILFLNEELIIALSLFSFYIILNYIIKMFLVSMIFLRNVSIYISFKSLIILNIALLKAILSITKIIGIISSNWLDYLNSVVRKECEEIIILYNKLINIVFNMVEKNLFKIKTFNLFVNIIFKILAKKKNILFIGTLLSIINNNINNNYCYRKNRSMNNIC